MEWQGYFYIENLGLTDLQSQILVEALKSWGLRNNALNPRDRNHWRVRIDGKAVIFEAVFNADLLTPASVKTMLANIFGISENLVSFTTNQNAYGEVAVFRYNNVDRLRLGVFGGRQAGYLQSQVAAQQFITNFSSDWNGGEA
jgi:hypothetical protein